ncbi:MAG: LysM peptidoglycan-binding domain-containing protein [Flavobacteriales bacterium]|nr:LysM peptidoglycan-binding domain-containing protein [Flavobacteriales bacterium]
MKRKTIFALLFATVTVLVASAADKDSIPSVIAPALTPDDPEMAAIDRILVSAYLNHYCYTSNQEVLNAHGYLAEQVPTFTEDVMKARLKTLDKDTPFDLVYNSTVQGFIDLYAVRRRELTSKVLGMSQLYFPLFEEYLAKYDIPLEMKYLAVIESALNPAAISSAGAGGLWQFMVSTGKMFSLDVTSYRDERFDMYLSTDAACRYLRSLFELYNDWELALAAYNSGPGNVNKAIRRAGGVKDFWTIKPYLPKETQGYVPAFIAVNYVMNYASEHNIYPKQPLISFFETDSVGVNQRIEFNTLSKIIDVPVEDLAWLNASYKKKEIPDNGQKHYLVLPVNKVGIFMTNQEMICAQCREATSSAPVASTSTVVSNSNQAYTYESQWIYHKVKKGESLGVIAGKHHVTLAQLKKWNHIKGSVIHAGQKLKVQKKVKMPVATEANEENETENKTENPVQRETASNENREQGDSTPATKTGTEVKKEVAAKSTTTPATQYSYYTIQPGDTLWSIANSHSNDGVTESSIKSLNKGISPSRLQVGQKIKLKKIQ